MTTQDTLPSPERIQDALQTLKGLISARFPGAVFTVFEHDDPPGTYLRAVVDVDDTDQVVEVYIDRLVDMQVDEGLPVYVITVPPRWRVAAMIEEERRRRRETASVGVA